MDAKRLVGKLPVLLHVGLYLKIRSLRDEEVARYAYRISCSRVAANSCDLVAALVIAVCLEVIVTLEDYLHALDGLTRSL